MNSKAQLKSVKEMLLRNRGTADSPLLNWNPALALFRKILLGRKNVADLEIMRQLFDTKWYLNRYADIAHSGVDPYVHYLRSGAAQGRDPHPLFSTEFYLRNNPDVVASDINPLVHYLRRGARELRDPHPLFSTEFYMRNNPDVAASDTNPLVHYLRQGARELRDPHPLFDIGFYLEHNPDVACSDFNPLLHYMQYGAAENRDPHPLFRTEWYIQHCDSKAAIDNPLLHFIQAGAESSISPHPLFDINFYRSRNPDVVRANVNPLIHYIVHAAREMRDPHPLFDTEWYLERCSEIGISVRNPLLHFLQHGVERSLDPHPLFSLSWYSATRADAVRRGINPLIHYVRDGWKQAASPHPLFDAQDYLAANPDVKTAGIDPLLHYLASGWKEGRSPHVLFDGPWYLAKSLEGGETPQNPLVHFLKAGASDGRDPNPFFDTDWYSSRATVDVRSNPLVHYTVHGWREWRNPSPLFDVEYYLSQNPDVRNSGMDPLAHYLASGRAEGRQPRRADAQIDSCQVMEIPFEIRRSPGSLSGRDVCLFVSYTPNGQIYAHVLHYLKALQSEGLVVILVLTTDGLNRPLPDSLREIDGIIVRANHGWDFAAWAAGLTIFPELWEARTLLFANDSVYGPVKHEHLRTIIERVRSSSSDLVVLTDSYQVVRHFMSYFIGLTSSGIKSEKVRRFWADVISKNEKSAVIQSYELKPLQRWREEGVDIEVLFPTKNDAQPPVNPTLVSWRDLLQRGFPFVKVQVLRDTLAQVDSQGWQEYLESNPPLKAMIDDHLSEVLAGLTKHRRPLPPPRRRFMRNYALKTAYGATESMRPTDAADLALEVPFGFTVESSLPHRVAVIAHVFYPEMMPELLGKIRNIPVQADLFFSTDLEAKKHAIIESCRTYINGSINVRVFPNRGRDVAPMWVGHADVFDRYEIFLHIHSKKSPHDPQFGSWRGFLLDNLLGTPEVVRSILRLFEEPDVGIVFSQHFPAVRHLLNWGYDFDLAKALLARAGIALSKNLILEFPSSSFFWGRSAAVRRLLDLDLSWSDFASEQGQIDGTLAHAIERSILYFAEAAGFRWIKVARSENIPEETLVPCLAGSSLSQDIIHACRPLLGNPIRATSEQLFIPTLSRVATRPEPGERPRLNILIPTLHPDQIFGGVTTALRTFHELADKLGDDFDLRIICTSRAVDLASMMGLSRYHLVPLSGQSDEFQRVVVDLTDQDGGELGVRRGDIFMATAWWTATLAYDLQTAQTRYHRQQHPILYLIQDHEPDFYGWSQLFAQARATYARPENTIALINSEELANYMARHYSLKEAYVVRYGANPKIRSALLQPPRERIILFYGRPGTPRNCFEIICAALMQWQQTEPTTAERWRVISAGEEYEPGRAGAVQNLEVHGKLTLDAYGDVLSRASVGISLMLSPHPSYPPLEMAHAGLKTITNAYECKDLALRNPNFLSVDVVTPEVVASAISEAVSMAEAMIGEIVPFAEIADIACELPDYDPRELAARLRSEIERYQAGSRDRLAPVGAARVKP